MDQKSPPLPAEPAVDHHASSHVLRALASGKSETVTFLEMMDSAGARVHGLALLLLVLPETVPLPLPSASLILAIPLLLISLHLALFGEGSRWPARLNTVHVRRSAVAATAHYVAPVLEWFENLSRPRWSMIARHEHLLGLVCAYLALILLLPLPLMNTPPAISMALIALGLIQRDGLLVILGLIGTIATTIALVWVAVWAGGFLMGSG